MTARDATLLAGGLIAGAVVAGALGVIAFGWNLFGDTETAIVLRRDAGRCRITGKQTEVQVGKNKKITWKVKNHCDGTVTVAVGNFRTAEEGANANCSAATEGGATSPFQQDDEPRRTAVAGPGTEEDPNDDGKIQLKVKNREILGGTQLTYHFDICLGGQKVDPRLIVEP